jgi:hypothetical protein
VQSYAITVNGRELSSILSPDQSLFYRLPDDATHDYGIVLSMKDGNITIGAIEFDDIDSISEYRSLLRSKSEEMCQVEGRTIKFTSGGHITLQGINFVGEKDIIFKAATHTCIADALLKADIIAFIGNDITLKNCFVDATTVDILPKTSPNSLCLIIRITFDPSMTISAGIDGHIDFEHNHIEECIISGARKVEILFGEKAFDSSKQKKVRP